MNKIIVSIITMVLLTSSLAVSISALGIETKVSEELKPISISEGTSFDGYTLLNPWLSKNTYLINNTGKVVHKWNDTYALSLPAYLLENGNLLRTSAIYSTSFKLAAGCGGRVEMVDWNGSLLWTFTYVGDTYCLHNDICPLPNGNILMIVWEKKTLDEAIAAGCDPNNLGLLAYGGLCIDSIIEVEPTPPSGGNIVWEWHVWDHLIQDFDSSKNNYGVVADHPELLDINLEGRIFDVTHINSIDYNETRDQLLITLRHVSEIWVIDHSTTTEEAAGHTGGNYGKGGDILYRWGNPQAYDAGTASDKKLFGPHDARWVELGCPGEGHITIFNNGWKRPGGRYSSIEEIVPPIDNAGDYYLKDGSAYGPEELIWSYSSDIYSDQMSGAQRLPNGNTFACFGLQGRLLELNPAKEIVWEYTNPYPVPIPLYNAVFKTQCYPKDYSGIGDLSANMNSATSELENTATSTPAIEPNLNQILQPVVKTFSQQSNQLLHSLIMRQQMTSR